MNFRATTTAILFLVAVSAFGQRYEKMLRTRTLSNHTIVGAEFHSSSNSVFILTNVTNSNGDGLLIKVNASNGDTIWSKYVASSSQPESYKGLYVSGSSLYAYGYRQHANLEYPFLVKLTPDGDTVWTRHYRTIPWTTSSSCANSPGVVNGLVELATGELVLVGRNNNCDRAFLLKTTSAGVISSVKEYDSWVTGQYSPIQEFFDVREHLGNLYVLYSSYGPNATNQNVQYKGVFKLNNAGDTIRHYHLSINHQNSEVFDLQLDQNSNMFVAGRQYLGQNNYGFIEKLNSTGVSQWVYSPGAATIQWSAIRDLQVDVSGNVLGSGYFQKSGQSVDQFVVKVLANGTESWLKQYGYGDNGWGRELVQVGNNYALISYESFCWSSYKYGFRYNNSPPCTDHVVIQMMNSSGELGRFYAPPQQSEKQGRFKFFKTVSFNFETQEWTNVSIIPVSLTSPTGASALYNSQNSNTNFAFQNSSSNYNGEGTFYFQASDKNGDVRFSDTLEVMPDPSFSVFDQFGNNSLVACMGDSLQLSVDKINVGSTYKWFYEGANGTSAAIRIATGASKYVKLSGYYKVREILASGDSATTSSKVLSIQTQKVKITSSSYPQTFYVSGSASDSLNRANPPVLNWTQNRNLQHWIAPFGRYREYNVQQYYYTAADLSSRGLKANSLIDEVAFVLGQSFSSSSSLEAFKISARWTTNTVNSWITMTGSDVVLDSYWQSPSASAGRKSFNINDLTWDGTRSLVIQVSYQVNSYNSSNDVNPIFKLEESSINVSRLIQSSTAITLLSNPGTSGVKTLKFRPLTEFKISLPAKNDTIVGCSSSIPLTVTNTGYQSLTWDNNSISSSRTVTSAGLRWVQMIDANFCLSNDTVQVIFSPNTNSITASNDTAVVGSSVTLSAASAYLNLWSNGSTGNSINASNTGTYTLTSINADGCSVKDSVKVTILDLPQIRIGRPAKYTGEVITGYTYMGKIGERHVYLANNCGSISSAQSAISNLKGEFWYPRTAAENSEINSIYKSKEGCCGELWLPVSRSSVGQPWTYPNGTAANYTNWDVNYNVNGLYAFINFGWNGFWSATTSATECRKYFVSFSDNSMAAGANESVCDSAFLWTKAGFDSYEWRKNGTVISGTTNSILSSSSGIYTVKGIRATTSYNGLSSVNLSINPSPLVSITNLSGTVDLTGSNSVKLKAIYPSGSSVQWFVNGAAQSPGQDSVVSNTVGWHRLVVTLNGCTSKDSVQLCQPIYVAKTGNNQTGNGSLSSPYLTIQKGINEVTTGGKIYVLPGVYTENVLINKQVDLRSNYDRLGDTLALHATIIDGGGLGLVVNINGIASNNPTVISGFTIRNGYNNSLPGAGIMIENISGAGVHLLNSKLTENARQCCSEGTSFTQFGGNSVLDNVRFVNNGSSSFGDERRDVYIRNGATSKWNRVKYTGNATQYDLISLMDGSKLEVRNSLFTNSEPQYGDHGIFGLHHQNTELTLNHVSIWGNTLNTHTNQYVVRNHGTQQIVRIANSIIDAGSQKLFGLSVNNQIVVKNSLLNGEIAGVGNLDSSRVKMLPGLIQGNGALSNMSPAIGHARNVGTILNVDLSSSSLDFNVGSRPIPQGSNPDAGAIESSLDQGVFGVEVTSCGWEIRAKVYNSTNYTISWSGPNGYTSSNTSITVTTEGIYTASIISVDRSATLTSSANLQNPLRADILTRDVCTALGTNSGYLDIRNVRGGTAFSGVNIASHKWGLKLGSNYSQGPNWDVWGSTWYWNSSNLSAGSYTLEITDASGCKVEYPFVLAAKNRRKAFVSTSGNDANPGTRTSPYRTVSAAIADACGLDTIVVLDGIYNEDSIYVNKALVIGSEYLLDGNTSHIAATKFIDSDDATFFYGGFNSSATADTNSSQLVGLTIDGGRNPHVDQWYGHGGAISVWNSVVKMNQLVLKNNTAKDGGAIGLMGHGFTAVVANCTIDGNTAYSSGGGLTANLTGDLWIRNTAFINNTANSGGGLWNQSNLVMTDVRIEGNSAQSQGGFWSSTISPWSSGTKRWTRVIVRNNVATSEFGGGYFQKSGSNSQFILDNVLIVNNASQNYPGIHFGGSDDNRISIINSTIYGNTGSGTSQAAKNNVAFGDNTRIRLLNSIIGRSGGASGFTFYATNCGTKYLMADASSVIVGGATSIFEDNCGGQLVKSLTGIKSTVPYFTDPDNGDYSLKNFSSFIGAGLASNSLGITSVSPNVAPLTLTATSKDVFGSARPNPSGSTIDIGAVENPLGVGVPGINVVVNGNGACQTANGSATVNLVQINGQPSGTPVISWIKLNDPTWTAQTTNTISGLSSGIYQVTVTVGTTAPFIDTAVVTTAAPLTLVNNSLLTNCFGGNDGTLKFTIQGGSPFTGGTYKYDIAQLIRDGGVANYTDNSTLERSANFISTQRTSGTYRISITDSKGCQFVDTITLGYRNALPTAQITASGPLTMCEGQVLTLTATTLNATNTYSWNDGSNLSVNTVGTSGLKIVTVTDTAGCINSDRVVVDVKATPVVYTGTPPAFTGQPLTQDYAYLGAHNNNHYYIYKYSNTISWTQAKAISEQFGGHLWVVNDASEQAAVTSMIQTHPVYYGEAFNGAYFENGAWNWVTGEPFNYFNWATNQANNGNATRIRVQFNWNGQWERYGSSGDQQKFIIEFSNGARNLATSEAFCDSVTVSAPEGFDSYVWKNTSNNNAVVGTSRSLKVTSSMAVKVEGTLNKSNNTTCTLESQTHTITINQTPAASIVNHSGTTDLYGNDTVVLGANVAAGATWTWTTAGSTTSLGSNDTLLVTSPNYYVLRAINIGCERRDSIRISQPRFVAKTGNNQNPGTLQQPYLTIQHAINQSSAGQKIYVLPGTYAEKVLVDRPIILHSNYDRIGDTAALHTTIIEPGTVGQIASSLNQSIQASGGFNIIEQGQGRVEISGFTVRNYVANYSGDWHKSSQFNIYNSDNVLVKNVKLSGATQGQGQGCCNAAVVFEVQYSDNVKFENVRIVNNGTASQRGHRLSYLNNSDVVIQNSRIVNNYQDRGFYMESSKVLIENSLFSSNVVGDEGSFTLGQNNNSLIWNYSTARTTAYNGSFPRLVSVLGSNNKVAFLNSVIHQGAGSVVHNAGTLNSLDVKSSVAGVLLLGGAPSGITVTVDSLSTVNTLPQIFPNARLMSNSPAIGKGRPSLSSFGKSYLMPANDLAGVARPTPVGSMPDAGAFESNLSVGELDFSFTTCGYQVTATVLNSSNYSVLWTGPGVYSSTQTSPLLPAKGIYQARLIAIDRQDTIVRTLNLNNPLEFTITSVKDVCEGVSANSGRIRVNEMKGGSIYQLGWGDYYLRVYKNGSQVWQNNIYNGPTNIQDIGGLSGGAHVVRLEDAIGCFVYDTVVIGSLPSNTYFISTTGSDTAIGTSAQPLKTISEALTRACDGDTVILEDGRHFENVIINSESPKLTIGSRYLLDGDTNHIRNAIVDGMDLNPVFTINTNNQGVTDTVRLNGFTVTNGLANSGWNGGGGISIRWSNASVNNMRIVENRSGQNGGGIGVWESQIKMKNVLIKDNFATNQGGGLHLQYINNDLIQSNVRIVGNRASEGGGLYYARDLGQQGQLYELDGFQIINNFATGSGGGVYINCWSGSADLQLSNSKIIGNVAGNEAGAIYVQTTNADVNFVNLIVARNEANHAGAIKVNNSKLNLIHSTLYQNRHKLGSTSTVTNLAIQVENQSTLKMYNSILGGQGAGGKTVNIIDNSSSFEVVSGQLDGGASTVQSVTGSTVTIVPTSPNYTDQLIFLNDPSGGDYGLTSVSKALGRGLAAFPTGIVMPLTDIYGNTRPNTVNSNPDLGAIESNETAPTFGVAFVVSDNNACNTSIGQITAHPQNGSGNYTYSWTALTSGGIITNPTGAGLSHTIANLFSGLYRVIVTDIAVTPNQVDTAIAQVRGDATLTISKTVTNEGCQGANDGSFEVIVSGGSGFYTYTWLKPNGTTANTKNLLNLSPGIYSITVTDNKGCSVSKTDTVGTSFAKPVINVTSQILKAGGTTITGGNDVRMCIGDQVVFNAGTGYDYYEWNKADGLNADYTQTVSTLVSQTYSVYVEDTNGCSTSGIAKVFVVYQPNVYASNVNRTMGQQFQQVTSYVRGDTSAVSGAINSNISPYNAQMGSGQKRMQFVLSASELQGAGLTENTTINSLAFDVVNPNGVAVQAYKLKLAHTTSQQLGTWQSPLNQTETFAIPVYSPVQGWNTHNFSNSFAWNGVDNLLVEVCYLPVAGSMSSATVRVNQVNTANTLTNFSYSATSCSGPVGPMGNSSWRPTVRFGIDKVEVLDTVRVCDFTTLNTTDDYDTYTWFVNGVANTTAGLALNLTSPANVYLSATDAASSCVMRSDTFYVALDATPTVVATSSVTGALCAGDTVNLGTTSLGLASYLWSNGDSTLSTSVFESGSYVLQARSANGCAGSDTVSVSVKIPPTVVVKLNGKTLTATDGSLATKASSCVQSVLLPVNENFEDSLYVWTQSTSDQLNWTFNSGVTNTQFSGPNGDFTTSDSSGNYYYLDRAGANSDDNKEAHLLSPCIQLVGAKKPYVAFGYHMYNGLYNSANPSADNMGTLRIEVQTTDDAANYWLPLWSKTGHQGAGWKTDTLNLTAFVGKTIRFRIVGKAGVGGPRSEMAIDRFNIVDTANAYTNTAGRISADIICEGDILVAQTISNGSSQFTYSWSNGDTTSSIKVDSSGYYSVTVMDENGCSISTDSVLINVSPIPNRQLTVTGDLDNCYNETVAVTVQAPASYDAYTWFGDTALTPNNAITTLVSLQGLGIGQYRLGVRIVDSIGCAAISDTLKINRFVQPTITSVVVPVACYGDSTGSVTVTPASGVYSYDWNTGDSTALAAGLWAANYSVIYTDVHGCLDTSSITVGQPNPLAVSFVNANTQPVSCFGGSNGSIMPAVVGGNGSYQYSWTGPNGFSSTAPNLINRVSGAYVLSVVDLKGCSIQDTHFVAQPTLLDAALDSASNVKCFQTPTGWISVDVSGGNGGNILNWKNSTGQIIANGDSIAGLFAGSYRFVVTDMKGCKDSLTHVITQPQLLDLTSSNTQFLGGVNVRCYGDNSGAITTNTVGGTLPYQWLWSNSSTSSAIDSLVSGTYSVTVTDAKGCKDSALIVLNQPTALVVNATASDVLCNSDQTGSVSVSSSGSISPYWLDWNTTGVDSSLSRVTLVLDLRSASSIATPTVAVVGVSTNIPMVSYNGDSIYYATIERKPGTPIYYRFYNGSTPELVPVSCGVNPPGLTDLHRVFTAGVNDTTLNAVCFASCVNCSGQQAGARSRALVSNSVTISNQGNGVVSWSIVDANGCLVSGQDTINQPLPITIQLDTIIDVSCPQAGDGSILINVSGGVTPYDFDWSNGDTIEDLLNEDEGPYQVVLSDNNGCVDSAQFVLGAPQPYNFEEVCMLTVDSLTGKNQVVWNKTSGKQTMEYQIFKETNVAGQYAQIGTVPYLNMSVFTDVNSVPQQQPDRYKIAVVDSCGNVSDTSDLHRTIHLQSSFGSSGEVNLSWTPYEGRAVLTYEIYRWISAGNLVQIGSVSGASNTFSDLNPPVAPIVNYNVRAIFSGDVCAPAVGKTSSYESARSNILDQTGIGMPDLPWKGLARMFPNPTNAVVRIEVPEAGFMIRVTNLLGQVIHQAMVQEQAVNIDLAHVAAGMYQVELYREGQVMSIEKLHVVH